MQSSIPGNCSGSNYVNAFAVESYDQPAIDAREAAGRLAVPFLLVHSEHALGPALARQFYSGVISEKAQLWLEAAGQIDFYDDAALIEPAADAATQLFRTAAL